MLLRNVLSIGVAVAAVPLILNFGFGYIDTIDRVGRGEEVTGEEIVDAGTEGIRPGQTSAQVEQLLGSKWEARAAKAPGETCRAYPLTDAAGSLVVCFGTSGTADEARWKVTRAAVEA